MENNQHTGVTQPIVTRHIPTPDGMTQIVSLQAGWWECLDWMIEQKGESVEKISDFCWRYIQRNPREEFASAFEYYLHCYMMEHRAKHFNLANDNYLDRHHLWER